MVIHRGGRQSRGPCFSLSRPLHCTGKTGMMCPRASTLQA